jgi:hypothetical protein
LKEVPLLNRYRRSTASLLILCLLPLALSAQALGATKKGSGKRVKFNRVSLVIPADWYYSKNPRERPGTDQLQLYSADRNRTVMVTLTKDRPEVDFIEAEHASRFEMLRRAMSVPGFEKCAVEGVAPDQAPWGRQGIFTRFDLYKTEEKKPDEIVMRVYNYGEQIPASQEVLFITAFVIGQEMPDAVDMIRSLEIAQ